MDLSVIIPCHNLEKYLSPLLFSLDLQERINFNQIELIFICDNCIDNTEAILKEWLAHCQYPNIKIQSVNVKSCGLARNEGFKLAKGNYIWFIDGDDWLISNRTFRDLFFMMNAFPQESYFHLKWTTNDYHNLQFNKTVWQYLFKKETIQNIKFSSKQPGEDDEFIEQIWKQFGFPKHESLKPLYFYNYDRPQSNTTQFNKTGHIVYED